jgi:rhodanese-related sulfurtransferase
MTESASLVELTPAAVAEALDRRAIVLVDVREPHEFAAERIPGALAFPLSTFDATALPAPAGRAVVFHCGSGKRSAMAVAKCLAQGIAHHTHMAGGIQAWKQTGLPTVALDPATGQTVRRP